MKKLIFTLASCIGAALAGNAQNAVSMTLDRGICLDYFEVHYSDQSTERFALGCDGAYSFDTGRNIADGIIINGSLYGEGTAEIKINGQSRKLECIQDESKGFSSLIR